MLVQFAIAGSILLASWLLLRRQAGGGAWALIPLDVAPILLGWTLLLSVTARPILAAVAVGAAAAGLVLADWAKRETLLEPLVFADRAELLEVVRHPGLYLPFAGPWRVVGGALAAVAAVAALVWIEPPAVHPSPLVPVLLLAGVLLLPVRPFALRRIAAAYRRLGLTGDPAGDMRRFGFLAGLMMQATVAREERPRRRAAIPPFDAPALAAGLGPVVLIQAESFFDARRLGTLVPAGLLPAFDRMRGDAIQTGLLAVPCWGANTVRSEFMVLTGIGGVALGMDRFNPYERFGQHRLRSIAWEMKRQGYRTICLHPFDRRFYARHRVMPQLGFDAFLGLEAFPPTPGGGYVTDEAIAEQVARIVEAEGPRVFVFAMTMANHGPWGAVPVHDDLPSDLPDRGSLQAYLDGLRATDRMIGALLDAMPANGVLALYGDHQPSLAPSFSALGLVNQDTDYAIWRPGAGSAERPPALCRDTRAEDLAECLLHHLGRPDMDSPGPNLAKP